VKQNQNQASRVQNSNPAQSKQDRKNTKQITPRETIEAPAPRWKPDRKWHTEQRRAYALLQQLAKMERPRVIVKDEEVGQSLWFARDSAGKELFFLEQPKFQYPGERMLSIASRKEAFNLIVIWNMPACLHDHMVAVLKKGGVW
jgi:hypothetical protein